MELARSLMFVPGHRQRMVDKALGLAALDVALLDIEDGVPPTEKDVARTLLAGILGQSGAMRPRRFVRVNAITGERFEADISAVVRPGLEGLLVPKVESAEEVRRVAARVGERERQTGLAEGGVSFIVAIESAVGLLRAFDIASASPRVIGLIFGGEDYANDLGLPTDRQGEARELAYARTAMVVAAAAAHVQSFDGVWPEIGDAAGLRRDSLQARRLGFTGKSLIHPGQIEVINEVFTPSEGDVDYARRVVAAFEAAELRGDGAIAFGGQLIDRPIVERARRVIALHEATG
ncbi:MAG TPA: CoA ester lyase [Candidatus Limnocylindria bacterium]|nr:CoA ester lyase [Candidatus Limnocylindria bacterium]